MTKQVGDKIQLVVDNYKGTKFNSPNDIDFDRKGGFYFTDPRYGNRDDMDMKIEGVYYVDAKKNVTRVIDNLVRPAYCLSRVSGQLCIRRPEQPNAFRYRSHGLLQY